MTPDRVDTARADRVDADRVDTARADRVDADRVDTARADRVDADRVDTARADRVDADRVDAARADRVDAGRVDAARADRVDAGRVDAARADRVDAGRVDTARADRVDAGRVDTARADRVDAGRVDAARVDRVNAARADRVDASRRPSGTPSKPHLPLRKRGEKSKEEPQEEPKKRRLPLRFPKKVRFQTVEEVEVDLETGDTKRTPVGNRPSESLKVVEHGELPQTDQRYAGRITDVVTDDQGRPYIAQNPKYQGQRPRRRLPKSSELEKGKIKKLQEELAAQGRDQVASPPARGGSRRSNKGSGKVSPAPGPGSTVRRGRRSMTALERTRLRNFAPR